MIVIFDTNAYRNLVMKKELCEVQAEVQKINALEQAKGILSCMSSTVGMELISHLLDDQNTPSFKSCLKACQAIYLHCGDNQNFRTLPLPEVQIAKEYFNIEDQQGIDTQNEIGGILYQISQSPTNTTIQKNRTNINLIKQFIRGAEQNYADQVLTFMKSIDPNAPDWSFLQNDESMRAKYLNKIRSDEFDRETAAAMLAATEMLLKDRNYNLPNLSSEQRRDQIDLYINSYKTALVYRKRCWECFIQDGYDLTQKSRANALWDEKLLHYVGHQVNGHDIILVTSDKMMKRAADEICPNNCVMSYIDYMNYIQP